MYLDLGKEDLVFVYRREFLFEAAHTLNPRTTQHRLACHRRLGFVPEKLREQIGRRYKTLARHAERGAMIGVPRAAGPATPNQSIPVCHACVGMCCKERGLFG